LKEVLEVSITAGHSLATALEKGKELKDGFIDSNEFKDFRIYLENGIKRPLKEHQYKAALHLLVTQNGANFSVPGSGKTAVVISVFNRLRMLGKVDALFVVGPPACFGPWRTEYEEVLGIEPKCEILAGGDIDRRRSKYKVTAETVQDLYLTTFQTLNSDWEHVRILFELQGIRFYLVIDEVHYIKQINGSWAKSVLNVAGYASYRCILTGTPLPHSFMDAFNLFDVLWRDASPIPLRKRHQIELFTQQKEFDKAAEILDEAIGPLFYRVRKSDLGLAAQYFNEPIRFKMNQYERLVYDRILGRIGELSQSDYMRDLDVMTRLRRGRMIRLRQCVSYTALLESVVFDYSEDLVGHDPSLSDIIKHYDQLEVPAKIESLIDVVQDLNRRNEKIVIWSNFIGTLKLIKNTLSTMGFSVHLIYGETPIHKISVREELTREEIIKEFVDISSGVNVLVANPAACAESISLHKTCSHAIYYDMSYNCAQYIQSLDRIHRVGGSENKPSYYYFLQYEETIDDDILTNVQTKADRMSTVIDQDYAIYSLDMFDEDEELEAYDRIFRK